MSKIERRYSPGRLARVKTTTSRATSGGAAISGHAAVFYDGTPNTEYEYFDIRERIMPGAFDRAIEEKDDARALLNHDPNQLLGRVSAGTLRLSTDFKGLRFAVSPDPELEVTRSVLSWIKRGELTGCSFAFSIPEGGERWKTEGKQQVREILSVRLFDVGPVTYPAYEATNVSAPNASASKSDTSGIPKLGDPYPTCGTTNEDVVVASPQWEWVNEKISDGGSVASLREKLQRQRREQPRAPSVANRRARLDENSLPAIEGYAAVWGEKFPWRGDRLGWFSRGSFSKALRRDEPTQVLVGHEGPSIATARLSEDEFGLRFKFRPYATDAGRDALAKIDRGLLSGVSPRVIYPSDRQWFIGEGREADWFIREVSEVPEISLTSRPTQSGTSITVRRTLVQRRQRLEERDRELAGAR